MKYFIYKSSIMFMNLFITNTLLCLNLTRLIVELADIQV